MYKDTDRIYIRTNYRGYIAPMKLYGPIVQPLQCPIKDVIVAIMSGCELHQVDPITKKSVKLTLANVKDDQKFNPITPEVTYKVGADIKTKTTTGVKIEPVIMEQIATPVAASVTTNNQVEKTTTTETTAAENRPMSKKELKRLRREQQAAMEATKQSQVSDANDNNQTEVPVEEQQSSTDESTSAVSE